MKSGAMLSLLPEPQGSNTAKAGTRRAEREGFEPSIRVSTYAGLANRCLQPLGHLSGRVPKARRLPTLPQLSAFTRESLSRSKLKVEGDAALALRLARTFTLPMRR